MTLWTRLAIMCAIMAITFAIWIGGLKLRWSLGLRDSGQVISLLLVLGLPALVAPPLARAAVSAVFPDAATLSSVACLWYAVALLAIWGGIGGLLILDVEEGRVAKLTLVALFVGAFACTYAAKPTHRPATVPPHATGT